jgi:hypothetical protein
VAAPFSSLDMPFIPLCLQKLSAYSQILIAAGFLSRRDVKQALQIDGVRTIDCVQKCLDFSNFADQSVALGDYVHIFMSKMPNFSIFTVLMGDIKNLRVIFAPNYYFSTILWCVIIFWVFYAHFGFL